MPDSPAPRRRPTPIDPLPGGQGMSPEALRRRNRRIGFAVAGALILIPVLVIVAQAVLSGR